MSGQFQENTPLMQVEGLGVTFNTPRGVVRAVRDASLEVRRGELVGLAGESGCGKSTTAFAIVGYLPETARVDGSIRFEGRDITDLSASELRHLRGNRIAMVYQDPATSLNPTMRVGPQIEEVLREHLGMDSSQARRRTAELFESVGLSEPDLIGRRYPHQISGGMQQRVVIAMALACEPDLLIMDEPTTGLDVTTEATILDLVVDLKQRVNAGILYVSHNLGVIARVADRVVVMYAGQTVEQGPVGQLFKSPKHPYTTGLLDCVPQPPTDSGTVTKLRSIPGAVYAAEKATTEGCLFAPRCPMVQDSCRVESPQMLDAGNDHQSRCFFWGDVRPEIWGEAEPREKDTVQTAEPLLSATGLRRFYGRWQRKYLFFGPRVRPPVRAVTDVDFDVGSGRTLGIVGESGSGKTTVARVLVGLVPRDRGELRLLTDEEPLVAATHWRRLAGFLLDTSIGLVTLGIGWLIWFLIVAPRGQTPGKQLLNMYVIRSNGVRARGWGIITRTYVAYCPEGFHSSTSGKYRLIRPSATIETTDNRAELAPSVEHRTREQQAVVRMVFQNPTASLNPRLPIRYAIIRSLRKFARLNKRESRERAEELLEAVGLDPAYLDRRPGQLSGGEQQRVALAGSFAGNADIIVADEAVSSLDVSVQAQVLNLLEQHQREAGASYIFISHDLAVVRYVSDDILVLYAGHVAESGPADRVLSAPSHPYTEALLSAAPVADPDAKATHIRLPGAVPTLRIQFRGCFFAGRCPRKIGRICDDTPPPARTDPDSAGHIIYCHIPVDELMAMQSDWAAKAT